MDKPPIEHPPVPYERHVFVCVAGKTCPEWGGAEIAGRLKEMAFEAGVTDRIRVNPAGCLNQCGHGPVIVVYPEQIWYAGVKPDDVEEIFSRTVMNGEVVSRLLHPRPETEEA